MSHPEIFKSKDKKEFDAELLKQEGLNQKEIDLLRVAQKNRSPENAKLEVAKNFEENLETSLLDKIKGSKAEKELEGEI